MPRATGPRPRRLVLGATVPATVLHFMKDQALYFAEQGWEVHLVTSPGVELTVMEGAFTQAESVRVHTISMERNPSPLADLRSLVEWLRLLRQLRPDVVMSGTPKAGLLGMLAARATSVPVRVYFVRGLRLEGQRGLAATSSWVAEKATSWASTSVLCVSRSLREELSQRRIVPKRKSRVLGSGSSNGVDTAKFRPASVHEREAARKRFGVAPDALLVGFAGRLTADKGITWLTSAMTEVTRSEPRAQLLLVGALDEALPLPEAFTTSLTQSWITHVGETDDMATFYRALDVFCLPSLREGLPNVNLEAASSGLPVVTTTATGCRDSVVDGVTGVCVPARDSSALAVAISDLLGNPERRDAMGRQGRDWVRRTFRRQVVWESTARFLTDAADGAL